MNRVEVLTRAAALHRSGLLAEADEAYRALLTVNPRDPDALHLTGLVALQRGDVERAIDHMRRSVKHGASAAYVHVNLGTAYRAAGRLGEAIKQLEIALTKDARSADAHNNIANALQLMGRPDAALRHFDEALELSPGAKDIASNRLYTLNFAAGMSGAEIARQHRAWGAAQRRPNAARWDVDRSPDRKLRVGWVSSDLRTHSVSFFFAPLLEAIDKDAFSNVAYFTGVRVDDTTARLRGYADEWVEAYAMTDDELAARVRADRIDVLVDLAGHTGGNRLGVFAHAPAPVQVSWLGYPNTTGLEAVGWRITDADADPEGADALYTERLVRLDDGFLCYEPWPTAPDVASLPAERRGALTFGSFNNLAKVGQRVIELWSRVLRAAPGSSLLVKAPPLADPGVRALLSARFEKCGVPSRSLTLLGEDKTIDAHLARYGAVDVALDTFPYNGTTTTFEALFMGVPTITLMGDRHAARVGASIARRVGLAHLVAETEDDFVATAVKVASNIPELSALRRALRGRLLASPLCDKARFARAMEGALRSMWRAYCEG